MSTKLRFVNRDMRIYHGRFADEVDHEHRGRCPCCGHPMVRPRRDNPTNSRRRDRRSIAHNEPVGYGGDPTVWVYACQGCNADQGTLSFRAWSFQLHRRSDARAGAVAALADRIEAHIRKVPADAHQ